MLDVINLLSINKMKETFEDFMRGFMVWFNQLNESSQVDDVIIDSAVAIFEWLGSLSLNQQLVLLAIAVTVMTLILFLFWVCRKFFFKLKRWYRRKRIPSNINLYLDAEREDL